MADLTFPHSLEAERAVLGALLVDNDLWGQVSAVLTADHFYRDAHKRIFRTFERLAEKRTAFDLITVSEDLDRRDELNEVNGSAALAALLDGMPRSINVDHYAQIVLAKSQACEVIRQALRTANEASTEVSPIGDVIGETIVNLTQIGAQGLRGDLVAGPQLAKEALAWLEEIEARKQHGNAVSGFATGLRDLDVMTDGLQAGDLILVAGRPSQGKTALGLQIALNDGPTAFFSLEMQRKQLVARAIATLAEIDGWSLRRGRLRQDEYTRVAAALEQISAGKLAIDDVTGLTVPQLRAKARRWQIQKGLKLLVVDYLTLLTPRSTKRSERNRQEQVTEMTQGLKETARELGVPVLALAQLNRGPEHRGNKEPNLADLRESGAIEQIADVAILIHRPDGATVATEGEVQLIIAKQRNGPQGRLSFWWTPSQTRFAPMPEKRA